MTPKLSYTQLKTRLKTQETKLRKLQRLVERDNLTGLYNRPGIRKEAQKFLNTLEKEVSLTKRGIERMSHLTNIAVIFIDLDNFKKINDYYGHDKGDRALQKVGNIIETILRNLDLVGRWSGDEFIAVLPGANKDIAQKRADQIQEATTICFKKVFPKAGASLSTGASAVFENGSKKGILDLEKLIIKADERMYHQKRKRKHKTNKT